MLIKKIKTILKRNVLIIDKYTPRYFKSDLLSVALARSGQYNKGCLRLPEKKINALSIDIEFKKRLLNEEDLIKYIEENKHVLIQNINRLFLHTFLYFIHLAVKDSIFDKHEWNDILNCTKNKYKAYLFEMVPEVDKQFQENNHINLLTKHTLNRIKIRDDINKFGFSLLEEKNNHLVNVWFSNANEKLKFIDFILENKLNLILEPLTTMFIFDFILSDLNSFSNRRDEICSFVCDIPNYSDPLAVKKLNILWGLCKFEAFKYEYNKYSTKYTAPLIINVQYLFITKKYNDIILLFNFNVEKNNISNIKKIHLYVFYSYCETHPFKLKFFFEKIRTFGIISNMYDMYESLQSGDISDYLKAWSKNKNGLQDYLDYNHNSCSSFDGLNKKNVLVISEAGIGDELRYSKLYNLAVNCNLTVTCDPRLQLILSSRYKNVTFIPHKRLFSRDNKTIYSYHRSNVPININLSDFDYCFALSKFSFIMVNDKRSRSFYQKRNYINKLQKNKIRIGIFWSSSLLEPIRQIRYSLSLDDYLSIINTKEFEVIAIQSNITDEERIKCELNNISCIDNIDINNDFDSLSLILKKLNFVIGPSSFNTELSSFFGVTFLHIANTPETILSRAGDLHKNINYDIFNENSLLISPSVPFHTEKNIINKSCIKNAIDYIREIKSNV